MEQKTGGGGGGGDSLIAKIISDAFGIICIIILDPFWHRSSSR